MVADIEALEERSLELADQLGRCLAALPIESLVIYRQVVADLVTNAFVQARTGVARRLN